MISSNYKHSINKNINFKAAIHVEDNVSSVILPVDFRKETTVLLNGLKQKKIPCDLITINTNNGITNSFWIITGNKDLKKLEIIRSIFSGKTLHEELASLIGHIGKKLNIKDFDLSENQITNTINNISSL